MRPVTGRLDLLVDGTGRCWRNLVLGGDCQRSPEEDRNCDTRSMAEMGHDPAHSLNDGAAGERSPTRQRPVNRKAAMLNHVRMSLPTKRIPREANVMILPLWRQVSAGRVQVLPLDRQRMGLQDAIERCAIRTQPTTPRMYHPFEVGHLAILAAILSRQGRGICLAYCIGYRDRELVAGNAVVAFVLRLAGFVRA